MRSAIAFLILPLFLISCASKSPQATDLNADTELGVAQHEETEEAQAHLEDLREMQRQEQKRQLERQITEPTTK